MRAHVFLYMMAYYVEWHLRDAHKPLLFQDQDRPGAEAERASPVPPASTSLAFDLIGIDPMRVQQALNSDQNFIGECGRFPFQSVENYFYQLPTAVQSGSERCAAGLSDQGDQLGIGGQ